MDIYEVMQILRCLSLSADVYLDANLKRGLVAKLSDQHLNTPSGHSDQTQHALIANS